ncbi:MAG: hypothetical protein ACPGUY_08275, partial [Akkermansiaceae bacterium]
MTTLLLGGVCLLIAVLFYSHRQASSNHPEVGNDTSVPSVAKSSRSSTATSRRNRRRNSPQQQLHPQALRHYLLQTQRGTTTSEVSSIIDEVKFVYYQGKQPVPVSIENLTKYRTRQIDLIVRIFGDAASLSQAQKDALYGALSSHAKDDYSKLEEYLSSPVKQSGQVFEVVP